MLDGSVLLFHGWVKKGRLVYSCGILFSNYLPHYQAAGRGVVSVSGNGQPSFGDGRGRGKGSGL